jgi:hypothetical protein
MGREIESRQGIGFAAVKNEARFRLLKTGTCAIIASVSTPPLNDESALSSTTCHGQFNASQARQGKTINNGS